MLSSEELKTLIPTLVCKRKKKPVWFNFAINDWIVQVIINDAWTSVYHSKPPIGTPNFIASTVDEAANIALNRAYEKFLKDQEQIV